MRNIYLDTNIIIDFLTNRGDGANAATQLFNYYAHHNKKINIASISYTNIYYILKKYLNSHKKVIQSLAILFELTETVDTTKLIIQQAIQSNFNDFEDAVQYHSALSKSKIDVIVSRDRKGFKNSNIPVMDAEELWKLILQENKQ